MALTLTHNPSYYILIYENNNYLSIVHLYHKIVIYIINILYIKTSLTYILYLSNA